MDFNYNENFKLKNNLDKKYQSEVFFKIKDSFIGDVNIADEILSLKLLNDFENSSIYYWDEGALKLYFILKCTTPNKYTKDQLKDLIGKNLGKDYLIYLNGKFYKGISNIDMDQVSLDSEIYILYKGKVNLKQFKKIIKLKRKYNLDNRTIRNILMFDNAFIDNKMLESSLQDNLFNDFIDYIGCDSTKDKIFEKSYPFFKKLVLSNRFTKNEIVEMTKKWNSFIRIDDNYYKTFNEVSIEQFSNSQKVYLYEKQKFKNLKNLKSYVDFQAKYDLNSNMTDYIWDVTYRLKRNNEIIESSINDSSFFGYYEYVPKLSLYVNRYKFSPLLLVSANDFKNNYYAYLLLKDSEIFSETQIKDILIRDSKPCISFTSKYWGTKDKKVKKVLENNKIKQENKYFEIMERVSYRKANGLDIFVDSIEGILLIYYIFPCFGYCLFPNVSPFSFTAIKFR